MILKKIKQLWEEQKKLVRDHGFCMVTRRIHTLLLVPFVGLAVLVIWLLKPLVIIRLGKVGLDRIGKSYIAVWYLFEIQSDESNKKYYDSFYLAPYTDVSNKTWFELIKRRLRFVKYPKFAHVLSQFMSQFVCFEDHLIRYSHPPSNEVLRKIFLQKKLPFQFTEEEEKKGAAFLKSVGIDEGTPFICFFSRDASYLEKDFAGCDWSYHDYRDTDIKNYVEVTKKIIDLKNYYAFRMGAVVDKKIQTEHRRIIDYATNGMRSEFLDVYLLSKCKYFLGADSGITIMAEAFKKPLIYTNWVSIGLLSTFHDHGLITMKKWYSKRKKRLLTFSEILEVANPHQINLEELEVELIDNSSEELLDAVEEMEGRLDGSWVSSKEDEKLQNQFWALYGNRSIRAPQLRIGTKFLRENQHLLN